MPGSAASGKKGKKPPAKKKGKSAESDDDESVAKAGPPEAKIALSFPPSVSLRDSVKFKAMGVKLFMTRNSEVTVPFAGQGMPGTRVEAEAVV